MLCAPRNRHPAILIFRHPDIRPNVLRIPRLSLEVRVEQKKKAYKQYGDPAIQDRGHSPVPPARHPGFLRKRGGPARVRGMEGAAGGGARHRRSITTKAVASKVDAAAIFSAQIHVHFPLQMDASACMESLLSDRRLRECFE